MKTQQQHKEIKGGKNKELNKGEAFRMGFMRGYEEGQEEMKDKQRWLRLDGDEGWQIVMPDTDILPHSLTSSKNESNDLAWENCPCKPQINFLDKIIVHNSFEVKKAIDESMDSLVFPV